MWPCSHWSSSSFWTSQAEKISFLGGGVKGGCKVSNEKRAPGCLGYIRDYATQVYRDYDKPSWGWKVRGFYSCLKSDVFFWCFCFFMEVNQWWRVSLCRSHQNLLWYWSQYYGIQDSALWRCVEGTLIRFASRFGGFFPWTYLVGKW